MPAKWRVGIPLLLLTVSLAALSRFCALDRIPPGIYSDEVIDGQQGLEAVRTRQFKVFYPLNGGEEGLWINLLGVAVAVFGPTAFALRFPAAVAGMLTVVFVYGFARELFSERIAVMAAWFVTVSFWALWISRIAFRAVLLPLLMTASLYFLLRAGREEPLRQRLHRRYLLVTLSGMLYGLGFHTYIAFRITPLIIVFFFASEYRRRKDSGEEIRPWLATGGLWLAAAFAVALPIGVHFLRHPEDFFHHMSQVSILPTRNPLRALGIAGPGHAWDVQYPRR